MTFRSDDDAREERVRSLEKQLEEARKELMVLRPKAVRLDVAEKENKRLMAEISARAGGGSPRPGPAPGSSSSSRGPLLLLFVLVGVLMAGLVFAGVFLALRSPPAAMQDRAYDDARARAEQAAAEQAAREAEMRAFEAAQVEAARREAEAAAIAATPEPPLEHPPMVDATVDFPPIIRSARVTEISGEAPVARRDRCRVTLTAEHGDCRASVICGDESLYPRTGRGGFFDCEVVDHVVQGGRDENPTPSSGDPRLSLDADAREITISDSEPDWSVRLTYDRTDIAP